MTGDRKSNPTPDPDPSEAQLEGDALDWTPPTPDGDREALARRHLSEAQSLLDQATQGAASSGPEISPTIPLDPGATQRSTVLPERSAGTRWGQLELLEKLGEGAFGEVYRARDAMLDREVALKLLRPGANLDFDRFVEEGRRLARIRHPNILVVHGTDTHDGRAGLWMDLVEGQTLEACLETQGTMSAHEATLVGIDLCRAVAAVHAQGLVHRDIKTVNVMRETGGRIVLMDFGSATPSAHDLRDPRGAIEGTPFYMAPELLSGAPPSPASDLFALGVLLYRLVSGRYPIEADNLHELLERRRSGENRPLREVRSDLPASFIQVVERATEMDPSRRYSGSAQLERALLNLLSSSEGAPVLPPPPPVRRNGRWLTLAAAVLLAAVIAWFALPRDLEVETALRLDGRPESLGWNSVVQEDDEIVFDIDISKPAYVYLINQDASGRVQALFPDPRLELQNPLPEGKHQLPGPTIDSDQLRYEFKYVVDANAGHEDYMLIISDKPITNVDAELTRLREDAVRSAKLIELPAPLVRGVLDRVRGTSLKARPTESAATTLKHYADEVGSQTRSNEGVHVRPFRLEKRTRSGTEERK